MHACEFNVESFYNTACKYNSTFSKHKFLQLYLAATTTLLLLTVLVISLFIVKITLKLYTTNWGSELLYSVQLHGRGVSLLVLVYYDVFPHANSLSNGDVIWKVLKVS